MLSAAVESYVALRRAAGYDLSNTAAALHSFARFASARGDTHVRTATVLEWAGQARSTRQRAWRLAKVVSFARHVHAEDPLHELLSNGAFGHLSYRRPTPFIYTPDQIRSLVEAASRLGPEGSPRPQIFATLLALLACTGLRISEALALQVQDLDGDRLLVRETKFRKTRLLVLHPTTVAALKRFIARLHGPRTGAVLLFQWPPGRRLRRQTAEGTFRRLADSLDLHSGPAQLPPRLHDLRHTFAVRSLEALPTGDRRRIARHTVALSTYLGHAQIADTYWYLEATPQLMTDIARAAAPAGEHL